ncbi:hypothetical protein AYI69_g9404 [Smittium culicis]|uniref:Uncharacterized protein n=1 Tax=Smittium culicis TaxID=133412 RepID=A0A1R1XCV5_9FUNG|nr:hypothetical protein AYI69_g9404 [Smittium culicis]
MSELSLVKEGPVIRTFIDPAHIYNVSTPEIELGVNTKDQSLRILRQPIDYKRTNISKRDEYALIETNSKQSWVLYKRKNIRANFIPEYITSVDI